MSEKNEKWCAGERKKMSEIVPMDVPISLGIEASGLCNFKCDFCLRQKKKQVKRKFITIDLFEKIIEDIKEFHGKVETITFGGNGEPLINPQIAELISMAKSSNICNQVKLFTNASLLTPNLNRKLVDSGLDVLRISLQGISSEMVYKVCKYKMDYEQFYSNIRDFYSVSKNREGGGRSCKVYVRILDSQLNDEDTQDKFYKMYNDCSDNMFIEHLVDPDEQENIALKKNMMNEETVPFKVCSYPFYQMNISAEGNVYPCCMEVGSSLVMGNIYNESLYKIWNGKKWNELRIFLLEKKDMCSECIKCNGNYTLYLQKEDNIDERKEDLLSYYRNKDNF